MRKTFLFEEKNQGQTPNKSPIIKSITKYSQELQNKIPQIK